MSFLAFLDMLKMDILVCRGVKHTTRIPTVIAIIVNVANAKIAMRDTLFSDLYFVLVKKSIH